MGQTRGIGLAASLHVVAPMFLNADPEVILPQRFAGNQLQPNDVHAYMGIARLKPGVSLPQANADVRRMLPIWITQYGTSGPGSAGRTFRGNPWSGEERM